MFSILNHKQFITFDRTNSSDKQTRNSRIDSLFGLLRLEKRRYRSGVALKNMIDQSIDFDTVDQKLAELRHETICFLNNALNA